jgi:hypothetical protein
MALDEVRITPLQQDLGLEAAIYGAVWAAGRSIRDVVGWYDDPVTRDRVLLLRPAEPRT